MLTRLFRERHWARAGDMAVMETESLCLRPWQLEVGWRMGIAWFIISVEWSWPGVRAVVQEQLEGTALAGMLRALGFSEAYVWVLYLSGRGWWSLWAGPLLQQTGSWAGWGTVSCTSLGVPVWLWVSPHAVVANTLPVPTFRNGLALNLHPPFLSCSSRGANLLWPSGCRLRGSSAAALRMVGLLLREAPRLCRVLLRGLHRRLFLRPGVHPGHNRPGGPLVGPRQPGAPGEGVLWHALRALLPHRAAHHQGPPHPAAHIRALPLGSRRALWASPCCRHSAPGSRLLAEATSQEPGTGLAFDQFTWCGFRAECDGLSSKP